MAMFMYLQLTGVHSVCTWLFMMLCVALSCFCIFSGILIASALSERFTWPTCQSDTARFLSGRQTIFAFREHCNASHYLHHSARLAESKEQKLNLKEVKWRRRRGRLGDIKGREAREAQSYKMNGEWKEERQADEMQWVSDCTCIKTRDREEKHTLLPRKALTVRQITC